MVELFTLFMGAFVKIYESGDLMSAMVIILIFGIGVGYFARKLLEPKELSTHILLCETMKEWQGEPKEVHIGAGFYTESDTSGKVKVLFENSKRTTTMCKHFIPKGKKCAVTMKRCAIID